MARGRNPSEARVWKAEWEYAARGFTNSSAPHTRFSWGNDDPVCDSNAPNGAVSGLCSERSTFPVGSFRPNAFGLYDMHGNVQEWLQDCYQQYEPSEINGAAIESDGCSDRVLRGGSWVFSSMEFDPKAFRSAARLAAPADRRFDSVGFRVARTP